MKLKSIKFSQYEGKNNEWNLDSIDLDQINLIVGKNATGKTKSLSLISNFAKLLCGELKPALTSANFDALFEHKKKSYRYMVSIENNAVVEEVFKNDTETFLTRDKNGEGEIWAEKQQIKMEFQTPTSELAITVRRDSIQHPYIEPLYEWANSVYYYAFGTPLGKYSLQAVEKDNVPIKADSKNPNMVVGILKKGIDQFGENFTSVVMSDMKSIDYHISALGLGSPSLIRFANLAQTGLIGLWVQEKDLRAKTEQAEISQGMFRALSLIIQLNYSKMALKPSCILIDDIGEGLDFDRSCALIELLIDKVKGTDIQLVMTTNDRFVMNKVPLEMWTVLQREGSRCHVYNIKNSREKFEGFRFTGLNNFDFFATDYLSESKK